MVFFKGLFLDSLWHTKMRGIMIADHVTQDRLQIFLKRRFIARLHRFQQIVKLP